MDNSSEERSEALERKADEALDAIAEVLKEYKDQLPGERAPTILFAGKTGNGKTLSINTLFGSTVGEVGHFSRGTDSDEVYEWESHGENINIVDLPGLGDSYKNDRLFREIYKRHVESADGFLIVTCPPRPAEEGTIKTVRLLMQCGVQSRHIIFGFNKLSDLTYEGNGTRSKVVLDGLNGVVEPHYKSTVQLAKEAFLRDLQEKVPRGRFSIDQIIEYDAWTGWNIYTLLSAVLDRLPYQTAARFKRAVDKAHDEFEGRVRKAIAAQKKGIDEERQKLEKKAEEKEEDLKERTRELRERERRVHAQEEALHQHEVEKAKFDGKIVGKILNGLEAVVGLFNPKAAESVQKVRNFIASDLPELTKAAKSTFENIKDKTKSAWKRWFG